MTSTLSLPDAAAPAIDRAPDARASDVVLRDGSTVRVRPVRPDDEARLADFLRGLSLESRAHRYFAAVGDDVLRREAHRQTHLGGTGPLPVGLVVTAGRDERILGHAEFTPGTRHPDRAEVAFTIADACQGQGLATILLGQLAQIASAEGVRVFEAVVLPENRQMLAVFRESGFAVETRPRQGEIHLEFPTEITTDAIEHFERREWTAAVNAVRTFFRPKSVAVIGASRHRGTIGGEVMHNLLEYGFQGPVLPVNPSAPVVQSVVAYPTVEDVPVGVDLAVIVVPAARVLEVAEACGRKRARALVILSAGFAESGPAGRERQDALVGICRAAGMRLIGPNCMGVLDTDPAVRLNATFAPVPPSAGRVAFMSQSGALGLAIMDHARTLGLGLSSFASVGNKADISGNDLIRYWADDPGTDVILLYLESFGNPRKFARIARKVSRAKPIVAVKSGRSPAGARATGSHTGALIAASDVSVDALFRQAGVIRTDTLAEMFGVASLLATQPLPRGRRVAILTNAGGPGILCADACSAEGLELPTLSDETRAALGAMLPPEASTLNPVDMIASATAEQFRRAIEIVGADPGVDAVVVIFIPPLVTKAAEVARAIVDGTKTLGGAKPVLTVFMQSHGVPAELRQNGTRIPSYVFPEDAALALARVARYGEWRAREVPAPAALPDARRDEAAAVVAGALGRGAASGQTSGAASGAAGGTWLTPAETERLLACYGLSPLAQRVVATPDEAEAAARALGGPVALKAIAPGLLHKTEAGAVRLRLAPEDVARAAREMDERLRAAGGDDARATGWLVQQMAPAGVEMILGVVHDPSFGPVVACGAGGVLVELLKDVSVRLAPLAREDADEMLRELKTYPLLGGYRGAPAVDAAALADAIVRVGAMVGDLPQIAELDLNPIVVHEGGIAVVDARVRVAPCEPAAPLGARG